MTAVTEPLSDTRRPIRDAGFSLIEMLVALVVIAAVLAALPGVIGSFQRVWQVEAELGHDTRIAATRTYLAGLIAKAEPLVVRSGTGRIAVAFAGTATRMNLVAATTEGPSGGNLFRYSIAIETPDDQPDGIVSQRLVLSQSDYVPATFVAGPATGGAGGIRRHVLIDRAAGMALRYFGEDRPGAVAAWHDVWRRADRLPDLVELMIPATRSAGPGNLPLIVQPRLASPD